MSVPVEKGGHYPGSFLEHVDRLEVTSVPAHVLHVCNGTVKCDHLAAVKDWRDHIVVW